MDNVDKSANPDKANVDNEDTCPLKPSFVFLGALMGNND